MEQTKVVDTNLLMEGIGKTTTIFSVVEYPKALEQELEVLWPDRSDYIKATDIMIKLLSGGKPVPAIDILIASVCINREYILQTKDKHFAYIKEIEPHFELELKA